jgi:hypothetical protein
MDVHVALGFVRYSIFTFALTAPVEVQVIGCTLPTGQASPPLGLVSENAGAGSMVNSPVATAAMSTRLSSAVSIMRTLQCVDGVLGMVHGNFPVLSAAAEMTVHAGVLALALVEYSTLNLPEE